MEGRNRSGSHSGGVVKNRSSSGCLIIKKKADGVSGAGSSKGRKVYESKKEKKRARVEVSESGSSDEELYRGRRGAGMKRGSGGSLVYENDFDDTGFGRNGLMREGGPIRRELDIYDFDEYDDFSDGEMMRMRHYHDRGGVGGGERMFVGAVPGMNNVGSGSSKGDIIYKRRNSFHGVSGSERIKGGDLSSGKRRFDMRSELPVSMGKEKLGGSDEAIRLQGKNGVLKVRVKHKEEVSEHFPLEYALVKGNYVAPRSQELASKNKNVVARPSPLLERNLPKKPIAADRLDKNQQKKRKALPAESSEESDEEANDSDSSPKLLTDSVPLHRSTKRGRSGGCTQSPQSAQPVKLKDGKVKRGSGSGSGSGTGTGTEKQLLREKIRNMLLSAGWTIDYRPRRGRDYFDAVYVNPTGTAYWSIIKAYDALQKQLEEEGNSIKVGDDCPSFAPISENTLSKLTRQTRKKIEKELKRKKREEAGGRRKKELTSGSFEEDESDSDSGGSGRPDDKLSSFMKHSGKSFKSASKESSRDRSNTDSKMQDRGEKSSSVSNSMFIHARNSKKIGRCTLLVRNSGKGLDSESDGFIPYTGKRNLLSWLIDSGTVKLSEKVHYMNRRCTRVMLEGWITREGIHCGCCSKILTVSKFEIHTASKLRQPYQNIYLSSGASLMQCQVEAWNGQAESLRSGYNKIDVSGDDPNDDTCAICCDGGNLICCDSCPSTFHQNCLGVEKLPPGDWHCPHCSCRFCGLADMSVTEENDKRQDTILTCSLCEGKYHCSCVEGMDGTPINLNSPPFCGKSCLELSERFQKLLGVKHELEAGLFWSLIHRTDLDSDTSVRGYPQRVEWNSKLAVALNVMDECFLPIVDRRSGINMIHSVLYNSGSNITRLDYSGFYTAILEKGDEIISAASIRIRSTQFAEMPFIGTRHIHRCQGMCRRLFSAIESALRSLKVEKLIIPAVSELMDTWTTVFGFSTLEESDKQDMKVGNMLVFPGTDMLQKKLLDRDRSNSGLAGANSFENDQNASVMSDLQKKSDLNSTPGLCSPVAKPLDEEMREKLVTDSGFKDTVCTDDILLDSAPAEVEPSLPIENEEMKEKSVTDYCSQDMVGIDENSLHSASPDCRGEVQPSLPTASPHASSGNKHASTAVSNEVEPLDSNKEILESTSSELQRGTKLNESAGDVIVKDHISADTSAGTAIPCDTDDSKPSLHTASATVPSLPSSAAVFNEDKPPISNEGTLETTSSEMQLDAKFNKSAGDEKDHISADASAGTATPYYIDDNKPSLRITSAAVSYEDKPLVSNEGTLETTSTEMQLDAKFNEPAGDVKGHISADANSGTATSCDSDDNKLSLVTASAAVPSLHASAAVADNVKPLDSNEGILETTSADMLLNTKLNESAGDVKDHISTDASTGTATPCGSYDNKPSLHTASAVLPVSDEDKTIISEGSLGPTNTEQQLDTKLYDSAGDVKNHIFADASEGSFLDDSGARHFVGVSVGYKLTQAANMASAESGLPPEDSTLATTSGIGLSNGSLRSDNVTQRVGVLHSETESAADGKYHSLSEASHIDVVIDKPMIEPIAEVLANGSLIVPAETSVCSGSQSLHVSNNTDPDAAHEPKIHISEIAAVYGQDHSEAFHVDVVLEKSMIEPTAEDSFCHPPESQDVDAHIVAEADVCSGSKSLLVSVNSNLDAAHEPKIHVFGNCAAQGKDHSLSEASYVDVEFGKPKVGFSAEDNVRCPPKVEVDDAHIVSAETDICSGSKSLHVADKIDIDAAHEPKIHVSTNDMNYSQITEGKALPVEDRACKSPQNESHSSVAIEKPQLESHGENTEQPTLESEVQHVEVASVQRTSNLSCEVSVNSVDGNTHSSEDPPLV